MREVWKDAKGFPGYRVSNTGKVLGKRGKVLKENRLSSTHTYLVLYIDGERNQVRISDIVASAFLDYDDGADAYVHMDGDRRNNNANNILVIKGRNYLRYIDELVDLMENEIFLNLYHYDDVFISNYGRVYSGPMFDFMVTHERTDGYVGIDITRGDDRNYYLVHKVVAEHFVDGETPERCIVHHKDGDKSNCYHGNLEWVSRSDNTYLSNKRNGFEMRDRRKDPNRALQPGEEIAPCYIGDHGGYMITNFGRVYSNKRHIWMRTSFINGYERGHLSEDGKSRTVAIHRLVAHAFISPLGNTDLEVNHINGDKSNNHADNLEWVTRSENNSKKFHETDANVAGSREKALTDADLDKIRELYATGEYTYREIGKIYNVGLQTICSIMNRYGCYAKR